MTRKPRSLSRLMAPAAPGRSVTLPGSCRNPGSSTIVPSRSRKTARLATQGRDYCVHLFWENGARVEQHATARHARDDRRIVDPQFLREPLVGEPREPGLELCSGERAAADFGIALDQLAAECLGARSNSAEIL